MRWILGILTVALIVVHQDFWNWETAYPLAYGFLPVGLWYQVLFCIAASILMALFVFALWPKHLEDAHPETEAARKSEGQSGH